MYGYTCCEFDKSGKERLIMSDIMVTMQVELML